MVEFTHKDLQGSRFEDVHLGGSRFDNVHLGDAHFQNVWLGGARLSGVGLVDVEINAYLETKVQPVEAMFDYLYADPPPDLLAQRAAAIALEKRNG